MMIITFFSRIVILGSACVFTLLALFFLVFHVRAQESEPYERFIVKYADGTDTGQVRALHRRMGARSLGTISPLGVEVIEVPRVSERLQSVFERMKGENIVEYVEPDFVAHAFVTPNDPHYGLQWSLARVDAPSAWNTTTGSTNVRVAVLDTGINALHGDLAGKVVAARNFTKSPTVDDRNGHGTHIAGIIAATTNNARGIASMGWNTHLLNGKVLDDRGSGHYSGIADGIVWATNNGAKVINLSLGGSQPSQTLEAAVNYAWSKGVVVVAAAGNNNSNTPMYPAAYENVIAVAATDKDDTRASFSNHGEWISVSAPGVDVLSTYPRLGRTDRYAYMSGTSMAAPHVAGLAALVWATSHGTNNVGVRARIENTADVLSQGGLGSGRMNAAAAVAP